ncbi:exo-beta-N-acetylmuramidase NamZ family protein [Salinimicrobium sp. GXAS 041]|uniref:exo-beta-N-acetylmuramidase NamZ family protein n=1 Tax=Salinimicrobium sp. GXAS 041 TaxID=3400806 RepID=UPI003C79391A
MIFKLFKSTLLFVLIAIVSCGNNSRQEKPQSLNQESHAPEIEIQEDIILGAARTDIYLPMLENKRVGIVGNQTSIITTTYTDDTSNTKKIHLVDSLVSLGVNVVKVFAPEHGFRGTADAGEVIKDGKDLKTGLPIISLYGSNKKPSPDQLKDIDVLIFDIQDVGTRFYTYISTLHYVMEASAENDIQVIVLDRPNPNGHYIDGPILEPENKSFVGMHEIPVVHGLTIGEYAKMINGEHFLENGIQVDLTVVEMENYNHNLPYDLPIKPSPNLPNLTAINLYPSLCFFEGTNVNAGRGTHHQFQVFGSPFLDKDQFSYSYVPQSNEGAKNPKHLGKTCFGKNLTDAPRLSQINLEWLIEAYENTADKNTFFNAFFTKLAGTAKLQKQIEAGMSSEEIRATWQEGLEEYAAVRENYLMYE